MKIKLRILKAAVIVLALSMLPIGILPSAAAQIKAYSTQSAAMQIGEGVGIMGMRVKVKVPVSGVGFTMPTWSVSGKYSAYISAYEWKGTYGATVAAEPFATKEFTALQDNATNWLYFEKQPAGEYFFAIERVSGTVGCWCADNNSVSRGFRYTDGVEVKGDMLMTLEVEGNEKDIFEECESTALLYGEAPVYEENTADMTDLSAHGLPQDSLYLKNDVMPDTWVFTDSLGRKALTNADVGDPRDDKILALFYWTWHASQGNANHFNVQQFLDAEAARGVDISKIVNDYSYEGWPVGYYNHFWDEPIYGYYRTNDEWVLRRQSEMLANALVDTVFTDNTNGQFTWRDSYIPLFEAWGQAQKDGVATPKVSFMLPFAANDDAVAQLKMLYTDIYRDGKYSSLWFWFEGKPMLMAHQSKLDKKDGLQSEIRSFFTFRNNYPGYINKLPNYKNWGWLSTYPQAKYYSNYKDEDAGIVEQISVGVSQNHNFVTHQLSAMNGPNNTGRTYTSKGYDTSENAILKGANFAEQFGYALEVDPKVIFVTGYNEWIAGRYDEWQGVKNAFPDQYNAENSRDIEPSRGVLGDAYYYQFVNFVRQYKGVRPIPEASAKTSIDVSAGTAQWQNVAPYYASYIGNTGDREAKGYGELTYRDYSGRNDIIGAQMARDDKNVYILVECAENISPYTDPLWMNIYLDVEGREGGWESFNYVINKTSPKSESIAVLERFTESGYESEAVADIAYSVQGRYLQVEIPKSALGIEGEEFTLNFAVTDNVHDEDDQATENTDKYVYTRFSGDILDFYTSGDVAPGGRFKYSFTAKATPAPVESEPITETEEVKTSGCGSLAAAPLAAVLPAAALITKKRKFKK